MMQLLSRNVGVAVAGGLGLAFLGYCVYFDHKRRSHPDFKRKLIESITKLVFILLKKILP